MKNRYLMNVALACIFALALPFVSLKAVSQGAPKGPAVPPPSTASSSSNSFWSGYAASAAVCSAVFPFAATVILSRELTPKEAISGIVGCWTFGIGSFVVDRTWDPKWNKLYKRP